MAARTAISIRYYLWADDGPWRLPVRLHQDLIAKKVALPQYAGTKQKILEVFARWISRDTYSLKGLARSASRASNDGHRTPPRQNHALDGIYSN